MKPHHPPLAALLTLLLVWIPGCGEYQEAVDAVERYCDGVERWRQTRGIEGHPDYHGKYWEVCK